MRSKLVDWLQLFRAQTAPATILLVLTTWMAAGGELFSLEGLVLGLWALLMHWFSFGHNSLQDSITVPYIGASKTWDEMDPAKRHHPLIRGAISVQTAQKVINTGLLLLGAAAVAIILTMARNPLWALVSLFFFYSFGIAYNEQLSCKTTILGFIPITVCFTALSIMAWFVGSASITFLAVAIFAYMMLRIWFQIDISGNIKEIGTIEKSIIKRLGACVRDNVFVPGRMPFYAWALTAAEIAVGLWIYAKYAFTLWTLPLILFFFGVGIYYVHRLVREREWRRDEALLHMSIVEIAFIYALPAILMPLIGYVEVLTLMALGVIYFFGINKLLWRVPYPAV